MYNCNEQDIQELRDVLSASQQKKLVEVGVSKAKADSEIKTEKKEEQEQKVPKKKLADVIIDNLENMYLFHNEKGEPYAVITRNGHREVWSIMNDKFRLWLHKTAWDIIGRSVSSEVVKSVIKTLSGKANFQGPEIELSTRIAKKDDAIWYDLSNDNWQVVKIDQKGWSVVDLPILFRRLNHQSRQLQPNHQGDVWELFRFINLKSDYHLLFLSYIISCFVPNIPHPIPVLYGEKGAAKTTTLKMIKAIIDPSIIQVVTFPKDINELVQLLSHHYFCGFDNITAIPNWISDTLCRAVTGEGLSKRRLYTDDEDVIYTFKSCIGINGINVVASREDLLDRCILLELQRILPELRKEDAVIWEDFNRAVPGILGGIFTTLSKALQIYPTVTLKKNNRMADFTRWGVAIAKALGGSESDFLMQYEENVRIQNQEAIAANPIAEAVVHFMGNIDYWKGKSSELLCLLEEIMQKERIGAKSSSLPKSGNTLTKKLNAVKSNLAAVGIRFEVLHTPEGNHVILKKEHS